jgi:biopolymer transport protein ExbD
MPDIKLGVQFEEPGDPEPVALQVAPMVDVVFLLICFFMLTAQLVQSQKDPTVRLPLMPHAKSQTEAPAEVTVNLRADGAVMVNGQRFSAAALAGRLTDEKARARGEGRLLRVVVRADRRQRFGALDEILTACRRAGLPQVVFRAVEEERP